MGGKATDAVFAQSNQLKEVIDNLEDTTVGIRENLPIDQIKQISVNSIPHLTRATSFVIGDLNE